MLEIRGLTGGYGVVPAFGDISIKVDQGETVALLGSNGAGKTALLLTTVGVLKPVSGSILFEGADIAGMHTRDIVGRGVVMVPSSDRVFPELTVEENLRVGCCSSTAKAERKALFDRVYKLFPRLHERKSQVGSTLSGGERGMLAVGRGVMGNPKILLIDEPSQGLAPIMIRHLFAAIQVLKEHGFSILLAEQNARMALDVCDRAYVLRSGSVVLSGRAGDLRSNESIRKTYLGG